MVTKETNIATITCGFPQVQFWGASLFVIFVKNLHKVTKYLDEQQLAMIQTYFNLIKTLYQVVNSELKLVNEWFLANGLLLNAKKSKYVLFHYHNIQ